MAQLRRMSRRDGVNMEYLKNIVVQYLSLRDEVRTGTAGGQQKKEGGNDGDWKRRVGLGYPASLL